MSKKTNKQSNKQSKNQTTKVTMKAVVSVPTVKSSSANLAKVTNQTAFLERYLRGTGRTLSVAQARANFGIQNLSARMSELRRAGLRVVAAANTSGRVAYSVSSRSANGSRARVFDL